LTRGDLLHVLPVGEFVDDVQVCTQKGAFASLKYACRLHAQVDELSRMPNKSAMIELLCGNVYRERAQAVASVAQSKRCCVL
jgi:hypothetical protein